MEHAPFSPPLSYRNRLHDVPMRWRVGRIAATCIGIAGLLFAIAGYVAGLAPMSRAGGELLGGVLMSIAGLSTILLLLTARTAPIEARKSWAAASVCWLLFGGLFGASAYRKVEKDIVERRQVHENLKALGEKLEAIKASGKKWDPVAGEFR